MGTIGSFMARLVKGKPALQGSLVLPVDVKESVGIGSSGLGRKSPLTLAIEASGARPGETVRLDGDGRAHVLGRKPELVVSNVGADHKL